MPASTFAANLARELRAPSPWYRACTPKPAAAADRGLSLWSVLTRAPQQHRRRGEPSARGREERQLGACGGLKEKGDSSPRKATIAKRPCLISAVFRLKVRSSLVAVRLSGSKGPPPG